MDTNNKTTIFLAIFTAVLAFIGALGGSLVSGYFSKDIWEKQITYEQIKEITKLRIDLIKEVSVLANQVPVMNGYQSYVELQAEIASEYIQCKKAKLESCEKPDDVKTVLEISNKRAELNARFASTLQMVTLYFGPATKAATDELAKMQPWWKVGEKGFRNLINIMNEELDYKITHNNQLNTDSGADAPPPVN